MKPPKTSYTKVGDALVAYQVGGEGAIDLVHVYGSGSVDLSWDHSLSAAFLERLASFSRLIQFDPRGWGMSDRFSVDRLPTWEEWAEDLHAVLDAVGSARTAIFAYGFASPLSMIFAATYPDRVSALIFFNTVAKWIASEDYPVGRNAGAGAGSR